MSILSDTAPKRIWLCVSDDEDDYELPYPELYAEDAEITWSADQPVAVTIEYVRNDLSELARLRAELSAMQLLLRQARGALDYHQQQTRPIHSTIVVLARIDDALASKPNE